MKLRNLLALILVFAIGFGAVWAAGKTKHTGTVKVPARIHVSGNFEGELEPCG